MSLALDVAAGAVGGGTSILYAALGETISERAGVLNIGATSWPFKASGVLHINTSGVLNTVTYTGLVGSQFTGCKVTGGVGAAHLHLAHVPVVVGARAEDLARVAKR